MSWAFWNWAQFWLVWVEVCQIFLESQHNQNYCFEVKCVFWLVELKWSQDKSTCKVLLDLCVLMMWSDWGWSFGEGANFYFSWGLKIEFLAFSGRESSLAQTFCESCEQLDITHPSIHMTRRFVIQGCPTLKLHGILSYIPIILAYLALGSERILLLHINNWHLGGCCFA